MEYKVKLSYLRISPRKVRLVVNLIRNKNTNSAKDQLKFSKKRAARPLLKLLNSAISNAKNLNDKINEDTLFIKKIFVDEGPKLKRFRPRARGMAYEIQKKTSHITLVLAEKELGTDNKKQALNNKKKTTSKLQKKIKLSKK